MTDHVEAGARAAGNPAPGRRRAPDSAFASAAIPRPRLRLGQAEALNRLGELALRTSDTYQARHRPSWGTCAGSPAPMPWSATPARISPSAGSGRPTLYGVTGLWMPCARVLVGPRRQAPSLDGRIPPAWSRALCGRIVRWLHMATHIYAAMRDHRDWLTLEERVACKPLAAVRIRPTERAAADPPAPRSAVP